MTGEFAIAVHALVFLNHKQKTVSSEELAHTICTNAARVRKVMAKLKKAQLIETKEGIEGGYRFDKNPKTVTLRQVLEAVDTAVIAVSWKSGDKEKKCLVSSGIGDIMDKIYTEMEAVSHKYLEQFTIFDIDMAIFRKK